MSDAYVLFDENSKICAVFDNDISLARYQEDALRDGKALENFKEFDINPVYQPTLFATKVATIKGCCTLYARDGSFVHAGYIKDSPELIKTFGTGFIEPNALAFKRTDDNTGVSIIFSLVSQEHARQFAALIWDEECSKPQLNLGV